MPGTFETAVGGVVPRVVVEFSNTMRAVPLSLPDGSYR
jgi:hypothetical protein